MKPTFDKEKILMSAGAFALLLVIFGVPAVLVPLVMDDVPNRSMIKVVVQHEDMLTTIKNTFARHRSGISDGRLSPLPENTTEWILLLNPMNRKAPGGGPAILPSADPKTGAIGLTGDTHSVTITLPAYRELDESVTIVTLAGEP